MGSPGYQRLEAVWITFLEARSQNIRPSLAWPPCPNEKGRKTLVAKCFVAVQLSRLSDACD